MRKNNTCCFLGHRKITETDRFVKKLYTIIENLIINEGVDTFLFGSKSRFNDLCYETVSKLKKRYPLIRRIYVRAEFPYIDEKYKMYLLEDYEDTYFPEKIINAGKAIYIERNYDMIDKSDFCIFYYDENYLPSRRKNCKKDITDYQPKKWDKNCL